MHMKIIKPALKNLVLAMAVATFLMPGPSHAAAGDIGAAAKTVPAAALVGEGRLRYLGFRIFDARLYAPSGTYRPNGPFALKLTYLRNFKGAAIADQTRKELRRQGMPEGAQLTRWMNRLEAILPDVSAGQSITGVHDGNGRTILYAGQRRIGTIADAQFTRRFFAIWLGPQAKDRALRQRLTGL